MAARAGRLPGKARDASRLRRRRRARRVLRKGQVVGQGRRGTGSSLPQYAVRRVHGAVGSSLWTGCDFILQQPHSGTGQDPGAVDPVPGQPGGQHCPRRGAELPPARSEQSPPKRAPAALPVLITLHHCPRKLPYCSPSPETPPASACPTRHHPADSPRPRQAPTPGPSLSQRSAVPAPADKSSTTLSRHHVPYSASKTCPFSRSLPSAPGSLSLPSRCRSPGAP